MLTFDGIFQYFPAHAGRYHGAALHCRAAVDLDLLFGGGGRLSITIACLWIKDTGKYALEGGGGGEELR